MSDDLSKLTPTDPSSVDPHWKDKRQSILDGVLADTSQRRRGIGRWVAGIAVAAVVAVAIGGVVQQLRPEPYAAPASPSASVSPIPDDQLVAARGTLIDAGDGITLCTGGVEVSRPPRCDDSIPVSGITWDDLDWVSSFDGTSWAEVVLVGTFDQTTFAATDVYVPHTSEVPPRPIEPDPPQFEPLCSDPVQGYGTGSSRDELYSILEDLPGFQIEWPSADDDFTNIAVTGDVTRAREIIEVSWSAPFCVGALSGPTHAAMEAATEALWKFTEDGGRLSSFGPEVTNQTHRLHITALLATPTLLSEFEQLVGPDVWPFTTVSSFFYPVLSSSTPEPTVIAVPDVVEVAALGTLLDTGTGITMCNGYTTESSPPQCPFTTPVTGITWADVPWAKTVDGITFSEDTVILGNFDGNTFVNAQAFPQDAPAIPLPPQTITDEELPTLCEAPTRGSGPDSVEALIVAAENLPGYQALWVSSNQVTYNAAFTEDVEGARAALADVYGGELCVGTVYGPTEQALQDAELALQPLTLDVDSATTAAGSVWSTFSSVSPRGNRLEVYVERETPDLLVDIESAVGPEVWIYTDVIPFFYSPARSNAGLAMPKVEGTHIAQGTIDYYRNGQISLCYPRTIIDQSSCTPIKLLGLEPSDIAWDQGSATEEHASVADAVVVGTMEGEGFRVERIQKDSMPVDEGSPPMSKDAALLGSAAEDLTAWGMSVPLGPTAGVVDSGSEGAHLVVHVLVATDDVVADVRERVGEDIWKYTHLEPFFLPMGS